MEGIPSVTYAEMHTSPGSREEPEWPIRFPIRSVISESLLADVPNIEQMFTEHKRAGPMGRQVSPNLLQ